MGVVSLIWVWCPVERGGERQNALMRGQYTCTHTHTYTHTHTHTHTHIHRMVHERASAML